MKKLLVFSLMIALIFCLQQDGSLISFAKNFDAKYTFYTTQLVDYKNVKVQKNGNAYYVTCNINDSKYIKNKLNKNLIKGESFTFQSNINVFKNLIKRYKIDVVSQDNLESLWVVNGYNSKFGKGVNLNGKNVNIQLAFNNGVITVGIPMILGSF